MIGVWGGARRRAPRFFQVVVRRGDTTKMVMEYMRSSDDDDGDGDDDIVALHQAHHDRLEELLIQTVEHLMDVDVVAATGVFGRFVDELEQGLALEEAVIMPAYRGLQEHAPQGRPDVVDGDHVILRRGIEASRALLEGLAAMPSEKRRRCIAIELPTVHRLVGTLEHHSAREDRHVYPAVVPVLSDEAREKALHTLRALTGH
jgi:hypothetical protein